MKKESSSHGKRKWSSYDVKLAHSFKSKNSHTVRIINSFCIDWLSLVVDLMCFYEDEDDIFLVFELYVLKKKKIQTYLNSVLGVELFDLICEKGFLSEAAAKQVIYSTVDAIRCCHKKDIVHRDIKVLLIFLTFKTDLLQLERPSHQRNRWYHPSCLTFFFCFIFPHFGFPLGFTNSIAWESDDRKCWWDRSF